MTITITETGILISGIITLIITLVATGIDIHSANSDLKCGGIYYRSPIYLIFMLLGAILTGIGAAYKILGLIAS